MEVSGVVLRSIPSFTANSHSSSSSKPPPFSLLPLPGSRFSGDLRLIPTKSSFGISSSSGFLDNGHLDYYSSSAMIRCGAKEKKLNKKMKLLKGLSKDLTVFSDLGFGFSSVDHHHHHHALAGEVQGKMISDAAELLLAQLEKLKAERKELKRKKKEDKAKLKAERMQNRLDAASSSSSSSSSSESSDSECGDVVDMSRLKIESSLLVAVAQLPRIHNKETRLTLPSAPPFLEANVLELQPVIQEAIMSSNPMSVMTQESHMVQETSCKRSSVVSSNILLVQGGGGGGAGAATATATEKKIEVCMGGKCKKSGGAALLDEFQRSVGVEGAVVGCKCMGKCRDGPNVRVLKNHHHSDRAQSADDSVRTPTSSNPLCIGVGLEDVGLILSNFFGDSHRDLGGGLPAAAAS